MPGVGDLDVSGFYGNRKGSIVGSVVTGKEAETKALTQVPLPPLLQVSQMKSKLGRPQS